ncbi:DUF2079 domain-containing protein [Cuniculiplasma sp. SKW4]|uniref:DUF2079 domain-containing protein n=1 Tax=Cuniculiplasma sp. SKW4 TaxID=3400171 RepID=UPI003FD564D4
MRGVEEKKMLVKHNFQKFHAFLKENIIPLTISLIFGSVFSIISYMRYLAFSQNVFDLGVNAALLYRVLQLDFLSTPSNPYPIAMNKLIYIPIGAVYALYPKEWIILFYQDFFLAFSGVLIYLISRLYRLSYYTSILVELLFFIYYPISGVYWFDFHFMAFFPTLFLTTFYLYKSGSSKWTFFAVLTTITDFMAPVIIFLFILMEIVKKIRNGDRGVRFFKKEFAILALSVLIFSLPFLYYRTNFVNHYVNNITPITLYSNPFFKLEFIIRSIIPLLFLPIVGIEYLLITFPYAIMVFFNNYLPYENLMFFQYPSLYAPFVFIAFIMAIKRMSSNKKIGSKLRPILVSILLLNLFFFSFYTPIGDLYTHNYDNEVIYPWVTGSQSFYETYEKVAPTKTDAELMKIVSLVPKGSSIFIQGNFPQFAQGYNYICPGQNPSGGPPDYIITDPYNYHFLKPIDYNGTILTYYKQVNRYLENYSYGTYAYYDGAYLFKLGYTGKPLIYGNTSYGLTLSDFHFHNNTYLGNIFLISPGYVQFSGEIVSKSTIPVSIYLGNYRVIDENISSFHFERTITSTTYLVDLNISIRANGIENLRMNITEWGA